MNSDGTIKDPPQILRRAIELQKKGYLAEAERLCLQLSAIMPGDFSVNHLLGIIRIGQGHYRDALTLFETALKIAPDDCSALSNYASAFRALGQPQEALAVFDRIRKIKPDFVDGHYNRANTLQDLKRFDESLEDYDRAIMLNPNFAEAHNNRGNALLALNRPNEALESYDRAVELKPIYAEAHNNKGSALKKQKRFQEALQSFDRAIGAAPDMATAYYNKGTVLRELSQLEAALHNFNVAIRLNSVFAEAHNNLGNVLQDLRRYEEALGHYDRAIAIKPDYAEAYNNRADVLGNLLRPNESLLSYETALQYKPDYGEAFCNKGNILTDLKRFDEAIYSYDQAIECNSYLAEAYWNKGLCRLLLQCYEEGWRLHEWRKKLSPPLGARDYAQPLWLGTEDISGRTLFVYAEQGLGDTIQFCRYLILAEARGAKVIFAAQNSLRRLLKSVSPTIEIIKLEDVPEQFDFHIPLHSMPLAFGTDQSNIPAPIPYLRAEPHRVRKWKRKIGEHGIRIGICWQGNKFAKLDIGRSISIDRFLALSKVPNVRLISLQKDYGMKQFNGLPPEMTVEFLGEEFDSGSDAFIDAAAVMEAMNLIITSDTAIAHLAGALGRPTWLALKYVPDWRWLLDRSDSPWYPTMRLFRQHTYGDWHGVFADIEMQLRQLANA